MKYFILIALAYNLLFSGNPLSLAKKLENQDISLYYYYWKNEDGVYYLGKKRSDGKYSVWIYTDDRKWKPLHNADSFDGFPKAGKIYKSVSFKDGSIMITTTQESSGDDDDGPPASGPPLPFSYKALETEDKTTTFKVDYYFWLNKYGTAFLTRTKGTDETSIWNYTLDRKWMPLYNAQAFDGHSAIGNTFDGVKIDSSLSKVNIGKFINHLNADFKLQISSNSLGDKNSLISDFLMMTPHFSWTYDKKYEMINEAFILQIAKKDGTLVYSTLLPRDSNHTKEGRSKNGVVIALPMNSFCEKAYTNVNTSNDNKIDYEATIYAIYDTGIINKDTCTKDIMSEENHLAKASMNMSIAIDSTVKAQSNVFYHEDEKYIEGSIKLSFRNASIKESIEDIKGHINITNFPEGFSVSRDLGLSHTIIDSNTLLITVEKTNVTLENKTISIEFLDTLFAQVPLKVQKAIVYIKEYQEPVNALPSP